MGSPAARTSGIIILHRELLIVSALTRPLRLMHPSNSVWVGWTVSSLEIHGLLLQYSSDHKKHGLCLRYRQFEFNREMEGNYGPFSENICPTVVLCMSIFNQQIYILLFLLI